jgi:glycosyltransferase involved in cell wall biosynthesis
MSDNSKIHSFLRGVKRVLTISPFRMLAQYRRLKGVYNEKSETDIFFFFPYAHIGGAEKVHANIVEALSKKKIKVFITGISSKSDFLYMFVRVAPTFNVGYCLNYPFYGERSRQMLVSMVNRERKTSIFGCNNLFFYDNLLKFNSAVNIVDLYHDFVMEDHVRTEDHYLDRFYRCNSRIFISNRSINEMKKYYDLKKAPQKEYGKLKVIINYTTIPDPIPAKDKMELNVLYVGRGTSEKRANLVGKIAENCSKKGMTFTFTAIGELEKVLTEFKNYLNCVGPITNFAELEKYYNSHHIVLITSTKEGFPLTIMEGMAHGLVPISSPVGDVPLHIENERGFVASSVDENRVVEEITEKIIFLSSNRSILEKYSENAFNYAKENFSKERFEKEYSALFEN